MHDFERTAAAQGCAKHLCGFDPRSVSRSTTAVCATPEGSWAIAADRVPEVRSFPSPADQRVGLTPKRSQLGGSLGERAAVDSLASDSSVKMPAPRGWPIQATRSGHGRTEPAGSSPTRSDSSKTLVPSCLSSALSSTARAGLGSSTSSVMTSRHSCTSIFSPPRLSSPEAAAVAAAKKCGVPRPGTTKLQLRQKRLTSKASWRRSIQ